MLLAVPVTVWDAITHSESQSSMVGTASNKSTWKDETKDQEFKASLTYVILSLIQQQLKQN